MEFEQLRQLDAIEREGTMSAAATALHISQPALSRSIQRLEAELGQELFQHRRGHVELNEAGRVAVDWSRQILRDERLMRNSLDDVARRAHTLVVGTVAPAPLWRLTSLLVERYPQETLTSQTLSQAEVVQGVIDGSLDLGIVQDEPTSPLLMSCPIMTESLSVSLPPNHPLAARRSVTFADLAGQTFLILNDIGVWRRVVDQGIPNATYIELSDHNVFYQLARSTPHCTFVTDAPYLGEGTVGRAVVPISDEAAHMTFYLTVRKDAPHMSQGLFDWAHQRS